MSNQTFLYRHDPIQTLRKKWRSGALHARRCVEQAPTWFPHAQLKDALETLTQGQALFRLSMWKNEVSALESLRQLCQVPIKDQVQLLQRIPADHEFFSHMRKDQDQYLQDAWLFWCIETVSGDSEVSTNGIPYEDIEVLTLDGRWIPYLEAQSLPGATSRPGWKAVVIDREDVPPRSIQLRTLQFTGGMDVMVFQPIDGQTLAAIGLNDTVYSDAVVDTALTIFPWLREHGEIWYTHEFDWGVRTECVQLVRKRHPLRLLRGAASWLGMQDAFATRVLGHVRVDVDSAPQHEVRACVDLNDLEQGDTRWCYEVDVLDKWQARALSGESS